MNITKKQASKALLLAMAEHRWSPIIRKTFRKSFKFYLEFIRTKKDLILRGLSPIPYSKAREGSLTLEKMSKLYKKAEKYGSK